MSTTVPPRSKWGQEVNGVQRNFFLPTSRRSSGNGKLLVEFCEARRTLAPGMLTDFRRLETATDGLITSRTRHTQASEHVDECVGAEQVIRPEGRSLTRGWGHAENLCHFGLLETVAKVTSKAGS